MLNIVGITLVRNKKFDKGIEQYQAAMSFVDEPELLCRLQFNLGLAHLRAKNVKKACEWFQKSTETDSVSFPKAKVFLAKTVDILRQGTIDAFVESEEFGHLEEELAQKRQEVISHLRSSQ